MNNISDTPVKVSWELAADDEFRRVIQCGIAVASPELGRSVHVDVSGLSPDRWYWYRFHVGDAVSCVGRTRTFPAPGMDTDRLRLAYASCQRWEAGYFSAYRHMAKEDLDAVLFLGDYIYEYSSHDGVRRNELPFPVTLADYRKRYELYKSDPDLQHMHANCPWILTWDDHEVRNDYSGKYASNGEMNFISERTAAYQAYYEHMPLRATALLHGVSGLRHPGALKVFDRFHFGRLATLHLLDTRQYRDLPLCGARTTRYACYPAESPRRSYLGKAQETWLDQGFRSAKMSGVTWNVIGSQTAFNRCLDKHGFSSDTWSGYRGAQERLIRSIVRSKVRNTIFLGGDLHENQVANIHQDLDDPTSPIIAAEFVGTSITSAGRSQEKVAHLAMKNPHWLFANSEYRGYGVAQFTPTECEVSLRALQDVADNNSGMTTLARFSVQNGTPRIRRVP